MVRRKRTTRPRARPNGVEASPIDRLIAMAERAQEVARTAKRNGQSLDGANFYANKMAALRTDATNAFREVDERSLGDASAIAELMESVFAVDAKPKARAQAARDLTHALRTTTAAPPRSSAGKEEAGLFPLVKLQQTRRGYLVRVGRQMNGAYSEGWYDASAVMMRRLLETVIIEAFEAKGLDSKIKNANGDFLMLTDLVNAALAEPWNLARNVRSNLANLKNAGHTSAHSRRYIAEKSDIDKIESVFREAVEVFLHLAGLL